MVRCLFLHYEHFEAVKKVIDSFFSESEASIKTSLDLRSNSVIKGKLAYIRSNSGLVLRIISSMSIPIELNTNVEIS